MEDWNHHGLLLKRKNSSWDGKRKVTIYLMIAQCSSPSSPSLHSWMFFECTFNITSFFRINLHFISLYSFIILFPYLHQYRLYPIYQFLLTSYPIPQTPPFNTPLFNPPALSLIPLSFFSSTPYFSLFFFSAHIPYFGRLSFYPTIWLYLFWDFSYSPSYSWFDLIKLLNCFPLVFSNIFISNHLPL